MADKDIIYEKVTSFFKQEFSLQSSEVFFSLSDGTGIMINEESFLSENTGEGISAVKVDEEFSDIVNAMPIYADDLSIVRNDTFYQLDEFYEQILLDTKVKIKGLSQQEATDIQSSFERKKTNAIKSFEDFRRLGSGNNEYRLSMARPQTWYTNSDLWKPYTMSVDTGPATSISGGTAKQIQFKLMPDEQEIKQMQDDTEKSEAVIKKRDVFMKKITGLRIHDLRTKEVAPGKKVWTDALLKTAPGFHKVQVTKPANPVIHGTIGLSSKKAALFPKSFVMQTGLIPALSAIAPRKDLAAKKLTISFEFLNVGIRRDWLDNVFLSDNSWYIPGMEKGSNSLPPDSNSILPSLYALPVSMVLIKNLLIQSDSWSDEDMNVANRSLGLSLFNLQTASVNSKAISVPTMQIVGWTSRKLPLLPPNETE